MGDRTMGTRYRYYGLRADSGYRLAIEFDADDRPVAVAQLRSTRSGRTIPGQLRDELLPELTYEPCGERFLREFDAGHYEEVTRRDTEAPVRRPAFTAGMKPVAEWGEEVAGWGRDENL